MNVFTWKTATTNERFLFACVMLLIVFVIAIVLDLGDIHRLLNGNQLVPGGGNPSGGGNPPNSTTNPPQ